MGRGDQWIWPPTGAPLHTGRDDQWSHFDSFVNAVSFGFVATAVFISMLFLMAIFERFLRPNSPDSSLSGRRYRGDLDSHLGFNGKLRFPSPKISVNAREVSVLMPGEDIPTFIYHKKKKKKIFLRSLPIQLQYPAPQSAYHGLPINKIIARY